MCSPATATVKADFAQGEVKVIVNNEEVIKTDIIFPYQPANRLSTLVHIGLGSGNYHLTAGYLTGANSGFLLLLIKLYAVHPGKIVQAHKAQVVAVISIAPPRIA